MVLLCNVLVNNFFIATASGVVGIHFGEIKVSRSRTLQDDHGVRIPDFSLWSSTRYHIASVYQVYSRGPMAMRD